MHKYVTTCKNVHLYLNATERRHFAEHFDRTAGEPQGGQALATCAHTNWRRADHSKAMSFPTPVG